MTNLRPLFLRLGFMISGFTLNKSLIYSRSLCKRLIFLLTSILVVGCAGQAPGPAETPRPVTPLPQSMSVPKENLLEKYAYDKGLNEDLVKILSPAGMDGILTEERKLAVNDLLELPKEYQKIAAEKILEDGKLTKEDLKYLFEFQQEISRTEKILSDLQQTNFTLEDGNQADIEKKYLAEPENLGQELFSYYISELKNINKELASQLEDLPELKNRKFYSAEKLEALEDIVCLYLHASNPEVKEAFDLMMKGGIPNQKDFRYPVPKYNAELEVLFWIAEQNEFKKDDTLALAMAMAHGLYITIGDENVRKAVYKDSDDLLRFFRETNKMQRARGLYPLEFYPLEAKVALAWTGGDPARGGRVYYKLLSNPGWDYGKILNIHHFLEYERRTIDLDGYRWNTISVSTLRKMRIMMVQRLWILKNVDETIKKLEEYFYFTGIREHWIFTQPNDDIISFGGQKTINHNMNNPELVFDNYLRTGKGLGVCGDEASLVESLSKSWGISTLRLTRTYATDTGNHDHVVYYEPVTRTWKCYEKQLRHGKSEKWNVYIFKPPVIQRNYFKYHLESQQSWMKMLNLYYTMQRSPGDRVAELFVKGIPTSQIKKWLFDS